MRVAYMLRNKHYSRSNFNDAMSQRVLDNYLDYLDFNRVYFTEEDINEFQAKYAKTLDDSVFAVSIDPAHEMHQRRMQRVEDSDADVGSSQGGGTAPSAEATTRVIRQPMRKPRGGLRPTKARNAGS